MFAGAMSALVASGTRMKATAIGLAVIGLILAIAIVLIPSSESSGSYARLREGFQEPGWISSDGRMLHWPDGLIASTAYLPLGSGLASYSYAYLPFQSDNPSEWFHHADNLWLEMLVEQGIVGMGLILTDLAT